MSLFTVTIKQEIEFYDGGVLFGSDVNLSIIVDAANAEHAIARAHQVIRVLGAGSPTRFGPTAAPYVAPVPEPVALATPETETPPAPETSNVPV